MTQKKNDGVRKMPNITIEEELKLCHDTIEHQDSLLAILKPTSDRLRTIILEKKALEAKLDKAMEALRLYAGPDCGQSGQSITKDGELARTVLKEIEGERDE